MEKKELRRQIREMKKRYTPEEKKQKSQSVWKQLEQMESFRQARIVLAYWSMEDEVFTHDFISKWADKKIILLPCVRGEELDIRYFDGKEKLCPGEGYAIPEPIGELFTELERIDLVVVPGVAFDKLGNRLGRGKGYYDKVLKRTPACKVGVCFDFQFLDKLPTEEHDVRMTEVIYSK